MNFKPELAKKVMAGEKWVTRRLVSDNPRSPWFVVLVLEAERAGARAVLAHWPPRKPLKLIPSEMWPA